MKEFAAFALSLAACTTGLAAQQVWVVEDGQPIQPVADAAASGDRIVVRGTHWTEPSLRLTRSVEIVGEGPDTELPYVQVESLPRRGQVILRNVSIAPGAAVRSCQGTVSFLDADLSLRPWPPFGGGIQVFDSVHVHLERCQIRFNGSGTAVQLWSSQMTLIDSYVHGGGISWGEDHMPAIRLLRTSRIVVHGSEIHGPTGSPGGYDPICWCVRSPGSGGPAIDGDSGVFVTGGSLIYGGRNGDSQDPSRPSPITVVGGRVSEDTRLFGREYPGIRRIPDQPNLVVDGEARLGGFVTTTVDGTAGNLGAVLVDLRSHGPSFVPDTIMPIWMTRQAWLGGIGVLSPGGELHLDIGIPNEPPLRFSGLWMQGLTLADGATGLGVSGLRFVPIR